MFQIAPKGRFGRNVLLAGIALCASLVASTAFAGECPADQVKPGATKPVDVGNEGVTDTVLATLDVAEEHGIEGRIFRMRRLEIEPGGTVGWHSHADRPAIIYIISGTVEENSSDCAVPIVHKAGDVSPETKGVSHWWKNTGKETAVLISADLPKDPNEPPM